MNLPKISHPTYPLSVIVGPNNKSVNVTYRPMLVKEEKILLMAKQSTDQADFIQAITQIVSNCVVASPVAIESFPLFAIQWMFLKIRIASVGGTVKLSYKDNEDDKQYDFDIDLNNVKLSEQEEDLDKIAIDDKITIILQYPPVSKYTVAGVFNKSATDLFQYLLVSSLDKVFGGDDGVYNCAQATEQELLEFIDDIPSSKFDQIQQFLKTIPTLEYDIKYTNSKGTERTIRLRTLEDFFTF
jgi:hypothetical protein